MQRAMARQSAFNGTTANRYNTHRPLSIVSSRSIAPSYSYYFTTRPIIATGTRAFHASSFGGIKQTEGESIFSQTYTQPEAEQPSAAPKKSRSGFKLKPSRSDIAARDKEVHIKAESLRASRKRLNPLLKQIRGMSAAEADTQLQFSPLQVASKVRKLIERGRRKAIANKLNPDKLLLREIYLTKGVYGHPKLETKARSKHGIRRRQTSHVFVKLAEVEEKKPGEGIGTLVRGKRKAAHKEWKLLQHQCAKALKRNPAFVTVRDARLWQLQVARGGAPLIVHQTGQVILPATPAWKKAQAKLASMANAQTVANAQSTSEAATTL